MALQVLTLDFAALEKSLSLLPGYELLGIEEELLPSSGSTSGAAWQATLQVEKLIRQNAVDSNAADVSARDKSGAFQLSPQSSGAKSSSLPSGTSHAQMSAPAGINREAAENTLTAASAETKTAESAFEELMLSGPPEVQQNAKSGHRPALAQAKTRQSSQSKENAEDKGKPMNLTEVGQANIEDLESWLDSL